MNELTKIFIVFLIPVLFIIYMNNQWRSLVLDQKIKVEMLQKENLYYQDVIYDYKLLLEKQNKIFSTTLEKYFTDKDLPFRIMELQPKLDFDVARKYTHAIFKYSEESNLPPKLVMAIIFRESAFNNMETSSMNARGPMQIITKFHPEEMEVCGATDETIYQIEENICVGTKVLRKYIEQQGSVKDALYKYVGGMHHDYVGDVLEIYTESTVEDLE